MTLKSILSCFVCFKQDTRGNIAIIFALSSTMVVIALGSGVDLERAYSARQKLSQAAMLTCQYSVRPSVVALANNTNTAAGGFATYLSSVNMFAANTLTSQHWTGAAATAPNGAFFTATAPSATANSTTTSTAPTNPTVEMSAQVSTIFMQIVKISTISVHAKIACLTASTAPQIVTSTGPTGSTNYLVNEGFENTCAATCFLQPSGALGGPSSPSSAMPLTPMYTGNHGQKWYILGYCLEIDTTGFINSTSPEGTHTVELDCDNGNNSAGNSSITTKTYLAAGRYELRYNYRSRVDYPNYDPIYICGTTAADLAWANETTTAGGYPNGLRTNQINVYLDMANTSNIPLHETIDGTQQLGGSNLIDMCIYSPTWIERSVKITVQTPAYYWLSFAADGANDSYGGQLDNVRLCQDTCPGTVQDNFPASWLAANNSGVNKNLFEDTFESPVYAVSAGTNYTNTSGNISLSTGSSGTAASGWPSQASSGWSAAPYNQVTYVGKGAYQGSQFVALDVANGAAPTNRSISRSFYLVPGYYQINYDYMSMVEMATSGASYCYAAPGSGSVSALQPNRSGTLLYGATGTVNGDTNILGVFMSNGLSISTPSMGVTEGQATPYTNPDGSIATYPTLPTNAPDTVDYQNYTATQVNPLIDECSYAPAYEWLPRSVYIEITKPGQYWLTFSATGGSGDSAHSGDGGGPAIDDVTLTALGSPSMSNPPTTLLTIIPAPAPQHDTIYYGLNSVYNGFYIVADPLIPPGADQ